MLVQLVNTEQVQRLLHQVNETISAKMPNEPHTLQNVTKVLS